MASAPEQPAKTDPPQPADGSRARPRWRWVRRAGIALLAATLLLAAAGWYLTRPHRLASFAESIFESVSGADMQVDAGYLLRSGEIELQNLTFRAPGAEGDFGRLLTIEKLTVRPNWWGVIRGKPEVTAATAVRPVFHIAQDVDTETYNFTLLPSGSTQRTLPDNLPTLRLVDARVQYAERAGGTLQTLETLEAGGELKPVPGTPQLYEYDIRERGSGLPIANGLRLSGQIDLSKPVTVGAVEGFSLEAPSRRGLPSRFRRWWDRLNPQGAVKLLEFQIGPNEENHLALQSASLVVKGIGITPAIGPFAHRSGELPRLSRVSGKLEYHAPTITIHDLRGEVEGIVWHIDGDVGLAADAPFDLHFRTDAFDLGARHDYLFAMKPEIVQHHERFLPTGRFKVDVHVNHPGGDQPVVQRTQIDLLGVRARYHDFPYWLSDLKGQILITDDEVRLTNIRGVGDSGAAVTINGLIAPPTEGALVDIDINVRNAPIDEHLRGAMKPQHRKIVDMFFDEPAYARLIEEGVIRRPDDEASDAPPFALGGTTDLAIKVHRDLGPDSDYDVTTALNAAGLSSLMAHWPYPLTGESGQVVVGPDVVEVNDVVLRGPGGGRGTVTGVLERPNRKSIVPKLRITDGRLPVDDLLLASMPSPHRDWLAALHLDTTLEATGRVFDNEQGEFDFVVDARVLEGTAQPFAGQYKLDRIGGKIQLSRFALKLDELAARRDDAELSVEGRIRWEPGNAAVDVKLTGKQLQIDPVLLDLLPPAFDGRSAFGDLFETYDPSGQFSASLQINSQADALGLDGLQYQVAMAPDRLRFKIGEDYLDLRDMAGTVSATEKSIEFRELLAHMGEHEGQLDGVVSLREGADDVALRFTANGPDLNGPVPLLLPEAARRFVEQTKLNSAYRIRTARVHTRPGAESGEAELEFEALIDFEAGEMNLGVPIDQMRGVLGVQVARYADVEHPYLHIALDADQLNVLSRKVEPLSLRMTSGKTKPDWLLIESLSGRCYGGAITGRGGVRFAGGDEFQLQLALEEAAVEGLRSGEPERDPNAAPLRDAQTPSSSEADPDRPPVYQRSTASGLFSAGLRVRGQYGDPSSLEGRGAMEVRNAVLFNQAVTLALLQAANLSLPSSSAFDRAFGRFIVDGRTLHFSTIGVEAPSILIVGDGTLTLPEGKLNLQLVSRNPSPMFNVVQEMLNLIKDELIGIRVTGTLKSPRAEHTTFRGLRSSWGRFIDAMLNLPGRKGQVDSDGRRPAD